MDLDPILSALSKLEQSINDKYNDLNDKYSLVHTQLEEFNNKITNLDEKVDSILSIANDLHTTSPTINDAAPDTPAKTKQFPFESMLQTWQSYCKDNNTTIIPKAETKLSGWV
jgi:oligoendopeptidase F